MSELARWRLIAAIAARDYRALVTWWMIASSTVPRAVLQAGFFTALGVTVAGTSRGVAFTGAIAFVITLSTVTRLPQVLAVDAIFDTVDALRAGRLPVFGIALIRSWVWLVEGVGCALAVVLVLGPAIVGWSGTLRLLALSPVLAVVAAATAGIGLTIAAVTLVRRFDTLLGNVATYLLLAVSGVIAPDEGPIGRLLPLSHGIVALRLGLRGQPWTGAATAALGAGLPWLAVAAFLMWYLRRRLAVSGDAR
jgi:hypothetical protein